MSENPKLHFVDIDGAWPPQGVIMHKGELLVFVRSELSADAPALKEMRVPSHLLSFVEESPQAYFAGQPAGSRALAVYKAIVSGGGLLIADYGKLSAFDRSVASTRHMGLTVYP